jgi:hypothetical protein
MAANQPDFVRYYLQFPSVTRTFLTAVVVTSISLALNVVSRYSLYTTWWGIPLRFFDAGWGLWFLMTLIMCTMQSYASDGSVSAEFPSRRVFLNRRLFVDVVDDRHSHYGIYLIALSRCVYCLFCCHCFLCSNFCPTTVLHLLVVGPGDGADRESYSGWPV